MRILRYKNSVEAFNGINSYLIYNEDGVKENGIVSRSQNIMYDTLVKVRKSMIPDDWDFTAGVNYRKSKWTSLVGNYVDQSHLQEVVSEVVSREIKKSTSYTVAFQFSNKHGIGKGCLLSCTFTRRPNIPYPILNVSIRASEVYKRLFMDFLLLHRIGQEAYGENGDFAIQLWLPHAWQGVSWGAMWMSLQPSTVLKGLKEKYGTGPFQEAVVKKLQFFEDADYEKFGYNADKRAAKVIQEDVASPPLLARDCLI